MGCVFELVEMALFNDGVLEDVVGKRVGRALVEHMRQNVFEHALVLGKQFAVFDRLQCPGYIKTFVTL